MEKPCAWKTTCEVRLPSAVQGCNGQNNVAELFIGFSMSNIPGIDRPDI